MDDTADLFTAPRGMPGADGPTPAEAFGAADGSDGSSDVDDVATRIQSLIERGEEAMSAGDEALAISMWSRVFLIKPNHPEAGHLIVSAKRSLSEKESKVEDLLTKARDAYDEGEYDAASLLVGKALAIRPTHLDVTLLKEELEREMGSSVAGSDSPAKAAKPEPESAPPSDTGKPEMPELDDDLFSDVSEAPVAAAAAEGAVASAIAEAGDVLFSDDDDDFEDFEDITLLDRLREKLPLRLVGIVGVALVVVLAGIWLGGRLLSSEPEIDEAAAVNEVLVEADRLFKAHKVDEALHLLREFPASGLFKQRIDIRIAKYEESIAPPTPTPVPEEASRAETLLDQGLWWAAFTAARDGLTQHPDDTGLKEIRQMVLEIEPEAGILENAIRSRDFRMAVSITEDLLTTYNGQGDLLVLLERALFNAALAEARAYNLTGAENHLNRLLELKPEDEETIRFLEMVKKYKIQAADMRLEIFIRSLDER
jgi:tetratricopeptide (TPR) repeat protein